MSGDVFSFMRKFITNNYKLLFPKKEGYVIPVSDIFFLEPKACDEARVPIMKLSQSSDDCYYIFLYNNQSCNPTAYLDFNKKLIAYGDKEFLTSNEKEFFTALEMELKGDEYVSEFNKEYKGVLPETIYRFDVGYFEHGALVQIHVLKDESLLYGKDRFKSYGWRAGYRYNAMVKTYEDNKTLLHLYSQTKENSLSSIREVVISAEEVENGIVKLIRVG